MSWGTLACPHRPPGRQSSLRLQPRRRLAVKAWTGHRAPGPKGPQHPTL